MTTTSMGAQAMERIVRKEVMDLILPVICDQYDVEPDDMFVADNKIAIPVLLPDRTESYVTVTVVAPRGTRSCDADGNFYYEPYDAESEVAAYRAKQEEKREKEAEKKRKAEKAKEKKTAKKVVKTMAKDIAEVLPSQVK